MNVAVSMLPNIVASIINDAPILIPTDTDSCKNGGEKHCKVFYWDAYLKNVSLLYRGQAKVI